MNRLGAHSKDVWQRRETALLMGLCVAFTLPVAAVSGFHPGVSLGALALLAMGGAALAVLGLNGAVILGMMTTAFLLMNRIDEGFAIPLGEISLKVTYLLMVVSVTLLAAYAFLRRLWERSPLPETDRFARGFAWLWWGFAGVALVGIPLNHLYDEFVPSRYLPGELTALAAVSLPMTFALWIPLSQLSRQRTLWCVRGLAALGGMAGLIMTIFGVLPDSMLGYLGWTNAIGGTSDLIRGRLPLGHPNAVAAVMLLLMPLCVIQGLGGPRLWIRGFYGTCAALMFCGVLFTLSRSALLNLSLVFIITIAYLVFAPENRRMWSLLLLAAFVAGLAIVAMALFARYDFSRFWSSGYHEEASVERRADSLKTAFHVWGDHPFWGVSPDAVYRRLGLRPGWTPLMEDSISPIIYYRGHPTAETPHNFYLTVFAEFGLLGAAFYFGVLALIARTLWKARRHPQIGFYEKKLLTGMGIGLLAFLMAGAFEAVLLVGVRVTTVFWIMAGLSLRYAFLVVEEAQQRQAGAAGDHRPLC